MIDFNEELSKFKPILEIEDIEDNIKNEEVLDIIDILKRIIKDKNKIKDKEM